MRTPSSFPCQLRLEVVLRCLSLTPYIVFNSINRGEFPLAYLVYQILGLFVAGCNFVDFVIEKGLFCCLGSLPKLCLCILAIYGSVQVQILFAVTIPPLFGSFVDIHFFG